MPGDQSSASSPPPKQKTFFAQSGRPCSLASAKPGLIHQARSIENQS